MDVKGNLIEAGLLYTVPSAGIDVARQLPERHETPWDEPLGIFVQNKHLSGFYKNSNQKKRVQISSLLCSLRY